jgi:hypothetical protein
MLLWRDQMLEEIGLQHAWLQALPQSKWCLRSSAMLRSVLRSAFYVLGSTFHAASYSKKNADVRSAISYVCRKICRKCKTIMWLTKFMFLETCQYWQNLKTRVWWGHETSCALGIRKKMDSIRLKKAIMYRSLPQTLKKLLWHHIIKLDFRLTPRWSYGLRSSGMLRCVVW